MPRLVLGRSVDILVSNAGVAKLRKDILDISVEDFDATINVNLRAAFVLTKGVVEGMKKNAWGRLIYVSSIAGYGAGINGAHYAHNCPRLRSIETWTPP
ncbi:MAG: SDR family NAD(P)-dependent oxidoreductase, partial [Terriglobus roseus]|nr:SDR family NAD(P)-dependent oxidoreductase [Terriglobus roseus]